MAVGPSTPVRTILRMVVPAPVRRLVAYRRTDPSNVTIERVMDPTGDTASFRLLPSKAGGTDEDKGLRADERNAKFVLKALRSNARFFKVTELAALCGDKVNLPTLRRLLPIMVNDHRSIQRADLGPGRGFAYAMPGVPGPHTTKNDRDTAAPMETEGC